MRQRFVRRRPSPGLIYLPSAFPPRLLSAPLRVDRGMTTRGDLVLRPVGELESATVSMFRQAISEVGPGQRVIVDLAAVPFIDSCGIGALIGAARRVRELGGAINLAAACRPVHRVLNLAGIDRIVELADTVDEASASLARASDGSLADQEPLEI